MIFINIWEEKKYTKQQKKREKPIMRRSCVITGKIKRRLKREIWRDIMKTNDLKDVDNIEKTRLYYQKNKDKIIARTKKWAENNKDKVKDNKDKNQKWSSLKRKYGLSKNDYLSLLLTQNYRCKICNNILDNGSKTHVDHDHETGKVRGILCSKCNVGLGNFKDSIQNLYNAIQYLQQNK